MAELWDIGSGSSLKFSGGVRALIFYSRNYLLHVGEHRALLWTSCLCLHVPDTHNSPPAHPPLSHFFCLLVQAALSPLSRTPPWDTSWQADGTDEDGRDWLIPNLLSPCHCGWQKSGPGRAGMGQEQSGGGEADGASCQMESLSWSCAHNSCSGPACTPLHY
ncbi:hypothetical protein WMY93_018356 [Mugilogobius chulae]|uniref:Uncharacterized protein n=1 Tax=Mugilogobius chulae TaxID=88201 RepID=A0AAW0NNH1_9GOBI